MTRNLLASAAVGPALAVAVAPPAQAAYIATMQQDGGDVVVFGIGSLDLRGLTFGREIVGGRLHRAERSYDWNRFPRPFCFALHRSEQPVPFGSSGFTAADLGSGSYVAVGNDYLSVPSNYTSGTPLSFSSMTFTGKTFVDLGVTVGSYVWSWGSEADGNFDTFTLNIIAPSPPVGVSAPPALPLFGVGPVGLLATRRRT